MELFDKVYSCYYQVIQRIIEEASARPQSRKEIETLAAAYGYAESAITIVPRLLSGDWALLQETADGTFQSQLAHPIKTPLTLLQKSWLKSLLGDKRITLFFTDEEMKQLTEWLSDTKPLYSMKYFHYYDRYQDGDSYESPSYRQHFQTVLEALSKGRCLIVSYSGAKGRAFTCEMAPYELQYSSKDDKFRICGREIQKDKQGRTVVFNMERIAACHVSRRTLSESDHICLRSDDRASAVIEISGQRNSLERTMLHFASYEKRTEYDAERQTYICRIDYDTADETELLIDILSFGPSIRVLGPDHMVSLMRERVTNQHRLFYDTTGDI